MRDYELMVVLTPELEEALGQRLLQRPLRARKILAEELEVAAEVEDEEVLLVLAGAEEVGTQPGAAASSVATPRFRRSTAISC